MFEFIISLMYVFLVGLFLLLFSVAAISVPLLIGFGIVKGLIWLFDKIL